MPGEREPIAIVGMGLKVPGDNESPEDFADFLLAGRSGIRPIPRDRWDVEAFQAKNKDDKGKITPNAGGFLDRIDEFDAPFFNISQKEAPYIDPQQRMVLETAWQALEHAGIDPTTLRRGNGGVYIGATSFDYALALDDLPYADLDGHLVAGMTLFPISGRLSYFLGWRGPSVNVDTACSSSLSALHFAVEALRSGECGIALCGGVNALHHPRAMVMFSHGQMLAEDGRCKTFDESADGYSRAEGCGILVLKKLSDAHRDGDTVHAIVRGTAIGQDGDSAGLTVPNGPAQELVFQAALDDAGLKPADIQYVEAHGTGTPLGDPIELGAIGNVFAGSHTSEAPLLVGSVKTNVGHMEPASGIVGVIKTVLQLRARTIYPHLNLETPSRRIPWSSYPLTVPTQPRPWVAPVRRAMVNSLGFAGAIASTVLEQAPETDAVASAPEAEPGTTVFTLSGKNAAGLRRQAQRYREFLDQHPDIDIADLCQSIQTTRAHLPHRLAGVVRDHADIGKLLALATVEGATSRGATIRKIAFLFSGQGSQYPGMGAALYQRHPVFRAQVDACAEMFAPYLDTSVRAVMFGEVADPALLDRTEYTQPALFTLEFALAKLWMSWGVQPNVLLGHSIGEVTAAAIGGVFDLPDAVRLVATRARLMQSVRARGGMLAVTAAQDVLARELAGFPGLALAAVNSPEQCVASGDADQLDALAERMRQSGVAVDRLIVSHAFHSGHMAEVSDEFRAAISDITFRPPTIPIVSNVTGALARFAEIGTPDYWVRQIGEPVLFMAGTRAVVRRGRHAFVEVGPSTALTAMARRSVDAGEHHWVPSLRRRDPGGDTMLRGLAELYVAGVGVRWRNVHEGRERRRIALPTYAFERKRYWLPVVKRGSVRAMATDHPLLGRERDSGGEVREFAADYSAEHTEFLAGHVLDGQWVLPCSAYLELLFALQDRLFGETRLTIAGLTVRHPLPLDAEGVTTMRTRARTRPDGVDVELSVGEQVLATASLCDTDGAGVDPRLSTLARSPGPVLDVVTAEDVYTDFESVNRAYGQRYRLLGSVASHADGVVTAELANRVAGVADHLPVEVLDCALAAVVALDQGGPDLLPTRFAKVRLFRKPRGATLRVVATVEVTGPDTRRADVLLLDGEAPIAELLGVCFARPGSPEQRPTFVHRLSWLRRRAMPGPDRPRHVLLVGGDPDRVAESVNGSNIRISMLPDEAELATALTDATVTDVCWFWRSDDEPASTPRLAAEWEDNYSRLLTAVPTIAAVFSDPPRLWLVTRRAQWLPQDRAGTGETLGASSLWGFGRTVLTEYPKLRVTLVDLPGDGDLAGLVDEWRAADTGEFQIAHRDGLRYVRRVLPGTATPAWPGEYAVSVSAETGRPRLRADTETADAEPGPGELRIRVRVAALDRDDLALVGSVIGGCCAGTVVAVGTGTEFSVGDDVLAYGSGTLRRTMTIPADTAIPAPAGVPLDAATAQLCAYPTAYSALTNGARVRPEPASILNRGQLPAAPFTAYSLDEVDEALAAVRDGDPAPVVVTLPSEPTAEHIPAAVAPVRPDRGYLITGGLGGLGLVTAEHLVERGAQYLILLSRSGTPRPADVERLTALRARADITLARADLGSPEDLAAVFADIRHGGVPLGGIVHAAGTGSTSLVAAMSWTDIEAQLRAQACGGWLLHQASLDHPELDFFVVYSSIASLLGGATQAHRAAASAFLDGLVAWRARQGLPALAVNWGAWAGVSARLDAGLAKESVRSGVRFFSPSRALRTLDTLLANGSVQATVGQWDLASHVGGNTMDDALYARLVEGTDAGEAGLDIAALVALAHPELIKAIEKVVFTEVAAALHSDDKIDPDAEFLTLGLDSLMALDLRTGLETAFKLPLPASLTFDHPSPRRVVEFLEARLAPAAPPR